MANVVPVAGAFRVGRTYRVRKVTAQATVGQTDWLRVPNWANWMRVTINLSAVAGTTPSFTPTIITVVDPGNAHISDRTDPGGVDIPSTDNTAVQMGGAILTSGYTAAGVAVISIGPGVTGIANDVALGTSGVNYAYINDILPDIIGIKCLNDRADGDETYTYSVDVLFRDK